MPVKELAGMVSYQQFALATEMAGTRGNKTTLKKIPAGVCDRIYVVFCIDMPGILMLKYTQGRL